MCFEKKSFFFRSEKEELYNIAYSNWVRFRGKNLTYNYMRPTRSENRIAYRVGRTLRLIITMMYPLFVYFMHFCSASLLLPFFLENSLKKPGVTTCSKFACKNMTQFENVVTPGFFKEFSRKKGRSNEAEEKCIK